MNDKKSDASQKNIGDLQQSALWESGILLIPQDSKRYATPYQALLDASDYESLENLLMERMDSAPGDISFFIPAYRAFVKRQESGRALAILQLHLDCLRDAGDIPSEIKLIRSVLDFWVDCGIARTELLSLLRKLYSTSPNYDTYAKQFNVRDAQVGLDTLRIFELWLRYDVGQAVYMPQKGVGRIKDVNFTLKVVRAQFENKEQISLKVDEAERLMQSLPTDHFLSQKLDNPEVLPALAASDPGELLRKLFASVKRPLVLTELREMLAGIIPDASWSSWWGKAKKDNRLMIGATAKPLVTWNDSPTGASNAIEAIFEKATPYEKLDLFEQHSGRSKDLAAFMLARMVANALAAYEIDPALCLELVLTLDKNIALAGISLPFTVATLVQHARGAHAISGIKDRSVRKKAIQIVLEVCSDWPDVFVKLLQTESDTQSLALMYSMLREKTATETFEPVVKNAFANPSQAPRLYLWLCAAIPARPELKVFADAAFLQTLLRNLDNSAFKGLYPQLRKLFDLGEAADYAVATMDSEACGRLLESFSRDSLLEDYRKERIRQDIFLRFPLLHEKKEHVFYVTAEALEKKRVEFEQLIRVELPRNSLEIQRTREYGDLRENFEYHAARARQEMLSSRAKTLHDQLSFSRAIVFESVDVSKISIGTAVVLREIDNKENSVSLSVLGPWDSDPAKNILSYTSAAGAAMLNALLGAEVAYNEKKYIVEKIEVWK